MKDLIPASNSPDLQLLSPMDGGQGVPPPPKFRLAKLLFFLRRFWWIPVITLTVSVGVSIVIFFLKPPTFVSTGSMWETEKFQVTGGAAFSEDRANFVGTQAQLLRSPKLREKTLTYLRATSTNNIPQGEDGEPLPVDISVFSSPNSLVYGVEARSANPQFTSIYLDALIQQYLDFRKNARNSVSRDTMASISDQVEILERKLKTDQAALTEYERSNNFAVLQEESTVEASYLAKLKTELSDYQLQLKILDSAALDLNAAQSGATNAPGSLFESLHNTGVSSAFAGRQEAARQIELLKAEREKFSKYLRPQHPKIVKLDEDIARAQKLVDLYYRQNQEQIATTRQALQIKIENTQSFITQWETKVSESNSRLASANDLKKTVARNQTMYDSLVTTMQQGNINRQIDQQTIVQFESASPARRSYKEAQDMGIQAILIGLVLGVGIVFLLAVRDDRFNSLLEVTEKFGDNVVGQVPEMPELAANSGSPIALLQSNDDRHMYAESYRNLRSALLYLAVDGKRPRVLLITSAVPNEGKSTVATNLARALALGGSKVLLVDADLRRGHIHERLGLRSRPGLTELLRESGDPKHFIQPTDLENFSFLPRGSICHNPGDLFLNPMFDERLARLREQFDYVIIDSSPVFAADDASTLAPKADGTLFVVRSRFSNSRAVREALNVLFQRQARVLGLILNRADTTARSYYAYKYAEYYANAKNDESGEQA